MKELKKVQRVYGPGFKIAVARDYLQGKLGYGALALKYQIPKPTACSFVKWYKKSYPEQIYEASSSFPELIVTESSEKALIKELQLAHLKIASLEMMIETAKKELDIDIIKKYGTKQP